MHLISTSSRLFGPGASELKCKAEAIESSLVCRAAKQERQWLHAPMPHGAFINTNVGARTGSQFHEANLPSCGIDLRRISTWLRLCHKDERWSVAEHR